MTRQYGSVGFRVSSVLKRGMQVGALYAALHSLEFWVGVVWHGFFLVVGGLVAVLAFALLIGADADEVDWMAPREPGAWLVALLSPLPSLTSRSVRVQPAVGAWMGLWARAFFRGEMLKAFEANRLDIQDDVFSAQTEAQRQWYHIRGRYYLFAMFFFAPILAVVEKVSAVVRPQP